MFFSQKAQNAKPRAAFTCIFNRLPALFQHHVYFHILTNCGRAMCLTFTSLQKNTGGWGVNVLANSCTNRPATRAESNEGSRCALQPAYPLKAYIFTGWIRLCKRPVCKRPGLATIGRLPAQRKRLRMVATRGNPEEGTLRRETLRRERRCGIRSRQRSHSVEPHCY